MRFSYHEMPPEPDIGFRVIGWKSGRSGKCVHFPKNSIDLVIGEHTKITIDNTIELRLSMESETEVVMNPLSFRNVFSKGKFHFVSISVNLW